MFGSKQRRLKAALERALQRFLYETSEELDNVVLPLLHLECTTNRQIYTIGLQYDEKPVALEVASCNIASIMPGPPSVMMHVPLEVDRTIHDIFRTFNSLTETIENEDLRALVAIARCAKLFILTPHPGRENLWPVDREIKAMAMNLYGQ